MRPSKPVRDLPQRRRAARAVTGLVMAIAGSLTLLGLVVIGNCSGPLCEKLLFWLGLATTGLISAAAQGLVLGGLWLLWSAFKTAGRPPDTP